jgi:DNA-binding SARP family transcriptional activator
MDTPLSATPPSTDRLRRAALAERVSSAAPAIVSLVAPAGFGKSSFVRELVAGFPSRAICDCRGLVSDLDLARRLVAALADEDPVRAAALAQTETLLGEGQVAAADRLGVVLAAWRAQTAPSVFVFEHAEDTFAEPTARDLLAKLLAARPDGRLVVVCSREPLRLHLARFAAPHRILTLHAADLAFTPDEVRALFAPTGAPAASVERAIAVAAGWPIAALLLARFAHEGRLEALLDRLDDVAYDELHDYLAEQVLGTAPAAVIDGLQAATMPRATARDVRLALGDDAALETFLAFAKTSPFVTRGDDGTFAVHPLVASTLRDRHGADIDGLYAAAAAAYDEAGEYQRAAEIQLARGDHDAAATALERIEAVDQEAPTLAYARILASLDRSVVLGHPRLWSVMALARAFTVDARVLLDEVEAMWTRLPADAAPALRISLYVFRILMLGQLGEFETALELVEDFRRRIAAPELPATRIHGWLLHLRAVMTAPLGRTRDAERDLAAAWPFVGSVPIMAGGSLLALGAEIARPRGDRASERERLERAIEHAHAAGLRNFVALYEAEAAFGAWLAGDDAAYAQHAFALAAEVEREGVRGFAFFAASTRGQPNRPAPPDQPKFVAGGHLIAAAGASDDATALRHADAARDAASSHRAPFMQVLAALAVAELSPPRRDALRDEAAAHARRIDATEVRDAVDAIARGADGGFLEPFVRRYRRAVREEPVRSGLLVELVSGRIIRDGEPVALAEREHALLTAISLRPEPFSRERLSDMLWPELGESAARNAFHVCIHRAKARLANEAAIVRTPEGYRLGTAVRVDLWEIERRLATLRLDDTLDEPRAAALRQLYEQLRPSRPPKFEVWEWFEATERRLRELRCEVAQALAKHALADGRPQDALAFCHEMIAYDPCDEPAREIAIRAYLAAGDRAAALRHFRQYRDVLHTELQCEPSRSLAELVGADP